MYQFRTLVKGFSLFFSQNKSGELLIRDFSVPESKGPFTQASFVAQLDAIFVASKLHQVSNMFET